MCTFITIVVKISNGVESFISIPRVLQFNSVMTHNLAL